MKHQITPAKRNLGLLALTAILAVLALAPSSASAATTCAHAVPGLLELYMSAHRDAIHLDTAGSGIRTFGKDGPVACSGAAPTKTNIDTVLIVDQSDDPSTAAGNDGDTLVNIGEPATFAPGKTAETGQLSEIEFLVDTNGGRDQLALGGSAFQQLVVGNSGATWNYDADAEMQAMPFDDLLLHAGDAPDYISAQGGTGTGTPLSLATTVQIFGGSGTDTLHGSNVPNGDRIFGGSDADTSVGFAGDDTIAPGAGDDTLQGGAGTDTLAFSDSSGPVTADLANVQAQETGDGRDSFAQFENVVGSGYADRLSGDSAANLLSGSVGDDTLEGRGGADELRGDADTDTVSYAQSTGPVNVDLSRTTQATDGDKLASIESLTGSGFADTLIGNAVGNRIVGGAGADGVAAGDGADRLEVRDGEGDRAGCGDGADTVISDRPSLDLLAACETVDALPEPASPQQPATDRGLSFALSGAKVQRVLRRRGLRLRVRCPLEACTTVTSASAQLRRARTSRRTTRLRLGPVTSKLTAGAGRTLVLRLGRRQLTALRRAFAAGQRPVLKVTVRARDAAGNRVTRTLGVTARR